MDSKERFIVWACYLIILLQLTRFVVDHRYEHPAELLTCVMGMTLAIVSFGFRKKRLILSFCGLSCLVLQELLHKLDGHSPLTYGAVLLSLMLPAMAYCFAIKRNAKLGP